VDIRSAQKRAWQNKVAKMAKNAARVYQRLPNGVLAKNNGDAD
jgi:hypothetical protein